MLKVLNGDYQPTNGEYLLDGVQKHFSSPHEAIQEGISVIYQERQILLELSVLRIFIWDVCIKEIWNY